MGDHIAPRGIVFLIALPLVHRIGPVIVRLAIQFEVSTHVDWRTSNGKYRLVFLSELQRQHDLLATGT